MQADNVTVNNIEIRTGESSTASILLENTTTTFVGFQMDITLPEGISLNLDDCQLSKRFSDEEQQLVVGDLGNNTYRLTSTSLSLQPITDNNGEIVSLSLSATELADGGKVSVNNIRFVTSQSERITFSDMYFTIQIVDVTPTITFVDDAVKSLCVSTWDVNGDGELSTREAAKVTDIGSVFQGNASITSFNELKYFIGLTSIGERDFQGCANLLSVSIPENVLQIGNYSFSGCNNLQSVFVYMPIVPDLAETTFSNLSNATLFVPRTNLSSYNNAEVWNGFSFYTMIFEDFCKEFLLV